MKKVLCFLLIVALVCTMAGCSLSKREGVVRSMFGQMMLEIQSNSMQPTFSAGDVIICEKVEATSLKTGDIIAYWTIVDGESVINVHRIYEIYDGGNYLIFATKGDNNAAADPLVVHETEVIGKYVRKAFLGLF